MTKVVSFDDDSDEEIELAAGVSSSRQSTTGYKGTIDQGVGTFIGSHSLTQSPVKQTAKSSASSSFANILPEMLGNSGSVGAPRYNRDDDVTRKLLNTLEDRNSRLEASKYELEQQLKKTEDERTRSQLALRNFEKLLAERDQRISEINKEK